MRVPAVTVMLVAALARVASAQVADDPCPSGVVRWTVADHYVEGRLLAPPLAGRPLTVAQVGMAGTRELDRTTPSLACRMRPGRKGKAALLGLGIGAVAGAALGFSNGTDTDWCFFLCSASSKAAFGAITFGAIGAGIGAIVGPGAKWAPLGPDAGARGATLTLTPHGVGVRLGF